MANNNRISGFFSSSGGGGGGTNPTNGFMPFNDNGTFADSFWFVGADYTNTKDTLGVSGNDFGFSMSFTGGDKIVQVGNFSNTFGFLTIDNDATTPRIYSSYGLNILSDFVELGSGSGAAFIIDDNNQTIYSAYQTVPTGLGLNFTSAIYKFGDYGSVVTNTYFESFDSVSMSTTVNTNSNGFYIEPNVRYSIRENTSLIDFYFDATNKVIKTLNGIYNAGLFLDYPNKLYKFGSIDNNFAWFEFSTDTINNIRNFKTYLSSSGGFGFYAYLDLDNGFNRVFLGDFNNQANGTWLGVNDDEIALTYSSNLEVTVSPSTIRGYIPVSKNLDGAASFYIRIEDV